MSDTDPEYIRGYVSRQPLLQRLFLKLFRKTARKLVQYCVVTAYQRSRVDSSAMHEVIGVLDTVYPPMK